MKTPPALSLSALLSEDGPKRRGRKSEPVAQTVIRPYIQFKVPGEGRAVPVGHDFFDLFIEAYAWKQAIERKELERQLRASKKQENELQKDLRNILKSQGIKPKRGRPKKTQEQSPEPSVPETMGRLDEALEVLFLATSNGDQEAAIGLLKAATDITQFVQMYYLSSSEWFLPQTRQEQQLPVLVGHDPRWFEFAEKAVEKLELGAETLAAHFKRIAYKQGGPVCRAWARAAVETLDKNRSMKNDLGFIIRYLRAGQRPDVTLADLPNWVLEAWKLPPFSSETSKQWGPLIRQMIRAEVPEFQDRPEFRDLVSSIKMRFRDEPRGADKRRGTIQNALLDRIMEAMETIMK